MKGPKTDRRWSPAQRDRVAQERQQLVEAVDAIRRNIRAGSALLPPAPAAETLRKIRAQRGEDPESI